MIFRRITLTCLLLLLVAAPAQAQRRGMAQPQQQPMMPGQGMGMMQGVGVMSGMMGAGMMNQEMFQLMGQGMGLMATGGPSPTMMLRMRDVLQLSDQQVQQLEQIQSRMQSQPMVQTAMEAQARAREALSGTNPDYDAYESALREAMDAMVQMHVELAHGSQEAQDVLNNEQRQRLNDIRAGMLGGMTGGGYMMGPGGR